MFLWSRLYKPQCPSTDSALAMLGGIMLMVSSCLFHPSFPAFLWSRMVFFACTGKHFFLHLEQLGLAQTACLHLVDTSFPSLSAWSVRYALQMAHAGYHVYLLLILELVCNGQYFGNVIGKAKLSQSLLDVIDRNGLLCFLFRDLVGLGRDQRNELDATFDE